jgi:A/G-specific adenine glycosylase
MRDLPWRHTRDPWAILVSEVMLQQTQVDRVIPKWHAFLHVFPSPAACAAASLGDVLRLWQGLGYPRRAKNLHATAAVAVEQYDGSLPASLDELLALPGIGPYTARAVLAFAFEADVAVVDTNIARIYARVENRRLTTKEVQRVADDALAEGDGWAWNQIIMDLGATLCRPTPLCSDCPLVETSCAWSAVGYPEPDPAVGSAGVSTQQARFDGSDRQGRGRLLKALSEHGRIERADVATVLGWPGDPDRAERVIDALVAEGLISVVSSSLQLPN